MYGPAADAAARTERRGGTARHGRTLLPVTIVLSIATGLAGVIIGGLLARHNARQDHADKLLAEALNDLVSAIAAVAGGDEEAQRRYASATSRIALHGSPALVDSFAEFQEEATTHTSEGRARLLRALQNARAELGRPAVDDERAQILLFGATPGRPGRLCPVCLTRIGDEAFCASCRSHVSTENSSKV
jgi:hypothetical protein